MTIQKIVITAIFVVAIILSVGIFVIVHKLNEQYKNAELKKLWLLGMPKSQIRLLLIWENLHIILDSLIVSMIFIITMYFSKINKLFEFYKVSIKQSTFLLLCGGAILFMAISIATIFEIKRGLKR